MGRDEAQNFRRRLKLQFSFVFLSVELRLYLREVVDTSSLSWLAGQLNQLRFDERKVVNRLRWGSASAAVSQRLVKENLVCAWEQQVDVLVEVKVLVRKIQELQELFVGHEEEARESQTLGL